MGEAAFTYEGKNYGFPMPEAIWRTNHGYDPVFTATALPSAKPGSDSFVRYMLLHNTFNMYNATSTAIADLQAVNLTAVVGDKGGSHTPDFVTCDHAASGE